MTIPRDLSNLAPGANTSGVLQPTKGGTGLTTPGTSGNVLTSTGSAWASSAPAGSGGATASGNVTLTSASSGAQSITTTTFGQSVTLPSATTMSKGAFLFNIENTGGYPLRVKNAAGNTLGFIYPQDSTMVGLSDNSTAAGVWNLSNIDPIAQTASYMSTAIYAIGIIREIRIDSDRLLFTYGSGNNPIYAQVYNETTQTWGTPTLVRAVGGNNIPILSATNQVLVCSCNSTTGFEAVVLTLSGTSITVNTAATKTLGGNLARFNNLIAVGSSFIVSYSTTANYCMALTISGTTVTISASETLQTGSTISGGYVFLQGLTASTFFVTTITGGTAIYAEAYSVSGTTITAGGSAAMTSINASENAYRITPISSGARWAVANVNSTSEIQISILSISGTTPTWSSLNTSLNIGSTVIGTTQAFSWNVSGSKLIIACIGTSKAANIVTDTGGTASIGSAVAIPGNSRVLPVALDSNVATFIVNDNTVSSPLVFGVNYSGSSPTLETAVSNVVASTSYIFGGFSGTPPFNANFTNIKNGAILYGTINYTFYSVTSNVYEVMGIKGVNVFKSNSKARPPIGATANICVGLAANEYVYYLANAGTSSNMGAVVRFESIT